MPRIASILIIMHGTFDTIVSPGEAEGYRALVAKRLGSRHADSVLAVYYIPGMGHGGAEYNNLIGTQIDALELWIDYRETAGRKEHPLLNRWADIFATPAPPRRSDS